MAPANDVRRASAPARCSPYGTPRVVFPSDRISSPRRVQAKDYEPQPPGDLRGLGPTRRGQRDTRQGEARSRGGASGRPQDQPRFGDARARPEPRDRTGLRGPESSHLERAETAPLPCRKPGPSPRFASTWTLCTGRGRGACHRNFSGWVIQARR